IDRGGRRDVLDLAGAARAQGSGGRRDRVSHSPSLRSRLVRTVGVTAVLGLAATTASFIVVRGDVDRINQKRVNGPANDALGVPQQLVSEVDQVFATAKGAVAANGGDPRGFETVLGRGVRQSKTLAGMALVKKVKTGTQVLARVGETHLLGDGR